MSLYIDYDKLTTHKLWDFHTSLTDKYSCGYWDALDDAMDLLNNTPTIEIIFCKDCKYFKRVLALTDQEVPQSGVCGKLLHKTSRCVVAVKPDSFCCFARRKDEEK